MPTNYSSSYYSHYPEPQHEMAHRVLTVEGEDFTIRHSLGHSLELVDPRPHSSHKLTQANIQHPLCLHLGFVFIYFLATPSSAQGFVPKDHSWQCLGIKFRLTECKANTIKHLPAVPWFHQAPLFLHADSRHSEAESASAH